MELKITMRGVSMLGLRGIKKIEKMFACMECNTTGNR